ncbi:MAG: hypothetical protein B7Y21_02500 [Hydrogenophilales bacterium 16-61-112]|nr:MAG: hypothetical protein B7Y21_02500 [Hydrogenophilales bacterium 16-61-112]
MPTATLKLSLPKSDVGRGPDRTAVPGADQVEIETQRQGAVRGQAGQVERDGVIAEFTQKTARSERVGRGCVLQCAVRPLVANARLKVVGIDGHGLRCSGGEHQGGEQQGRGECMQFHGVFSLGLIREST